MYKIFTLSIAALIAIGTVACQTSPATSNNTANQTANKSNTSATQNANQANKTETNTAANDAKTEANSLVSEPASTPTAAYKAYYAACKNKDIVALKKLVSKDMFEFFEMMGKDKPDPLDAGLREMMNEPQGPSDETRNEKINGNVATLQYIDANGDWISVVLIKEDGAWKLTVPQMDYSDDFADDKKSK